MFKFDIFWILVFFITIVLIYLSFVKLIKTKKVNYMPVVHFFLYLMSIFKAPTISNCILGIKWLMYLVVEYKLNTSGLAFVYDNAVFVAVIGESYSFLFGCWIHKYTSRTSFFVNYYTVFFIKTTLCFLSVVLRLYKENSRLLRTRVKKD